MRRPLLASGLIVLLAVAATLASVLGWIELRRNGNETLVLPGIVQIQEVHLGPRVAGRVAALLVREGELVDPGRVLLRLEVPDLDAQVEKARARLDLARAQLEEAHHGPRPQEVDAARAAVRAAEAHLDLLRSGARPEEILQAKAELAAVRAEFWAAERELERRSKLTGQGAASAAELDLAASARDRLKNRVNAAQAYLDLLYAGTRIEELQKAEAQLQEARAKLALLEAGTRPEAIAAAEARVAEAEAELHHAEFAQGEAVVSAPEKAVIEVISVRPGDVVQPNQSVIRILRASDLWIKAYVPETQLGRLRLNQGVLVTTDSYPGVLFQGTIEQISSISEFTPRNVQSADQRRHQVFAVKVRVNDPRGIFKSGMAADVRIPLHDPDSGPHS